jgi:hypothetical protein
MEKRLHLAPRQIGTPMRVSTKFQMMSCQSTLRRTSLNKTKKIGDDATVTVPLTEGTQLLELSALKFSTDRETYDRTWMKQMTMHSTVL